MARNTRIKAARAERDLTQKALAEAVGISRQTMNAIEQGDYNPTIKLCRAICREKTWTNCLANRIPTRREEPLCIAPNVSTW